MVKRWILDNRYVIARSELLPKLDHGREVAYK